MTDGFCESPYTVGIGIDLVEVARVRAILERSREAFLNKTFTQTEIDYCVSRAVPEIHFAARFAAKEAMAKALGSGIAGGVTLAGLSIENDEAGCPIAVLDAAARARMQDIGGSKMLISITHTKEYAQAMAIVTK